MSQSSYRQEDWSVGEVHDVAPQLISPSGAASMGNVLLDEDGSPYERGGTAYLADEGLGADGLRWLWNGFLKPGARSLFAGPSDFGVLSGKSVVNLAGDGLSAPKQAAALEDILYVGGGTLYAGSRKSAPYSTGTITVTNGSKTVTGSGTTWNTLVDAGMLLHLGSERVYVVASIDSTTQLTLRDAYQGSTGGGKAYSLNPVWSVGADPYEVFDYVTVCANRLVFGAGRTIKFTEVNNPHSFTNSLGTTNEHTVPEGAVINGLWTVGQTVLIFTTAGVWTLDGLALGITDLNGNPQHRLQQLSSELVLAGAPGIAGVGQRVVVPCGDGIYLMDGISQPIKVSKPIDRTYLAYLTDGYRLGQAAVYRGHYFLPVYRGLGVEQTLVCRLDRPTRDRGQTIYPWTHLTGDGGENYAYAVRTSVDPQEPELLGAQGSSPSRVVDCSGFFSPHAAIAKDADGSVFNLDIITRDIETGGGTVNRVRAVKPRYELEQAGEEEEPRFKVSFSDGSRSLEGFVLDVGVLDETAFGEDGGVSFTPAGEAGPSDGRNPERFRVNKKARYIRFHITSDKPAARCVLRSLEMTIRPSEAKRR